MRGFVSIDRRFVRERICTYTNIKHRIHVKHSFFIIFYFVERGFWISSPLSSLNSIVFSSLSTVNNIDYNKEQNK